MFKTLEKRVKLLSRCLRTPETVPVCSIHSRVEVGSGGQRWAEHDSFLSRVHSGPGPAATSLPLHPDTVPLGSGSLCGPGNVDSVLVSGTPPPLSKSLNQALPLSPAGTWRTKDQECSCLGFWPCYSEPESSGGGPREHSSEASADGGNPLLTAAPPTWLERDIRMG